MALINELNIIGNAIREKTGGKELIPLKEMASAILSIQGGGGVTESIEYADIVYNEDNTITLTETNGTIHTMACEYDGDKLISITYDGETIELTYDGDVLVAIGGMSVDMSNAPATSGTDTRLKELVEGTLTELVDDTITTVRKYGFYYSTVEKVDLPNCTTVASNGLQNATNLTSVNLPQCKSLGSSAFNGCSKLASANIPNCESIGISAFNGCSALESVDLSNCVTLNKEALKSCAKLTSLVLPNCTTVGESAFYGCSIIERIDLPIVTDIGKSAFYGCRALTTLIIRTNQVVTAGATYLFMSTPIASGTGYIYVPDDDGGELIEAYKNTSPWSTYADQIKGLSELGG